MGGSRPPGSRPPAARFDAVDEAGPERLIAYLDAQAAAPFWRERKRESLDLLDLRPGLAVLDVGCGTGAEVRAMAARVSPGGHAVGVDASSALIAEARKRTSEGPPAGFQVGDAQALPFAAATFDAVRIERTLQHLADPDRAVAELVRVCRPGARVVALEPDWGTLAIEGDPAEVSAVVGRRWAAAIAQPFIGGRLGALLRAAGLRDVRSRHARWELGELAVAARQLDLDLLLDGAVRDGELSGAAAEAWLAGLRAREARGRFAMSVAYVTAVGSAPEG